MNFKNRNPRFFSDELVMASIKRRFLAYIIDWVVIIILYGCLMIILQMFNINITNINAKSIFEVELETNAIQNYARVLLKILFGILPILYFTFLFYFFDGRTIGKFLLRIKVVSLYHEHLGLWHCIERSLGYYASTLEGGFGFIQALWNPNRMTLHDKIGETIVISLPQRKKLKSSEKNHNENGIALTI
jgi:uncharacterized RDD family membrane protein YckC